MKKILDQKLTLNNGVQIPALGFGSYMIEDPIIGVNAIKYALKIGYRLIDTADFYKNHHIVAKAIQESGIDRKDIFITSKIWRNIETDAEVVQAVERILKELETDYLDLCLIHWPTPSSVNVYKGLEKLYKKGIIKAIGVSNFMKDQLQDFIQQVEVIPAVDQVELHPHLQLDDLVQFAKSQNIKITSWQTIMKGKIGEVAEIKKLAQKYNVTPFQLALRWAYQRGIIIIPKSVHENRIFENQDLDNFIISDGDMQLIKSLDKNERHGLDPYAFGFTKAEGKYKI
ncbi:aldo/keto reductase [Mycoplasma sp. SG1]|uniref:aldo/keto reductase n=1 Tax=Mycoplasma sp. SG1 TaxID=2810348 RepID=UPI002023BF4B|nr:aldo/keto reductase [Mycoplasma sp. SG1]URM53177.1 aldo/keto reductase [Mycoplasma sp. SG1]